MASATKAPSKSRRIRMPGTPRTASASDDYGPGLLSLSFGGRPDPDGAEPSILPPAFRSRLYGLFNQIEGEFEALYAENLQRNAPQ